jgi:hypothetical protein
LIFTLSSFASSFYFNERLFHIDYIFSKLDPNLIADFSDSSKKNKENLGIQIFQALVFDDLKENNK